MDPGNAGIAGKVVVITGGSSGLGEATGRYEQYAIHPESFARAVAFAISQPDDVDVNEILFRPTGQEL